MTASFDPLEPGFTESPYEQYARLRADDPVHRSELLHGWVLTRYADVDAVLRDPRISVEPANAAGNPLIDAELARMVRSGRNADTLVLRDDPDHNRLRRLLQAPFGPRAVEKLGDVVRSRVAEALDGLAGRSSLDVVIDFAYPLPVSIFCEVLGVPDEDTPKFRLWTQAVARNLDPLVGDEERTHLMGLFDDLQGYLEDLIEVKRSAPADDILSSLVLAEEDGDRLSRQELVAQLVTLYVAGHEPVSALVGNGLLALLRHPDQLAALRADVDGRLPNAVSELLRYDGPNQFVRRIALDHVDIDGRAVAPGEVIYAGIGAANRDPARWGHDAEAVHIDRADASSHLQFGGGVHNCLGTHLARLQAEVMLRALLTRLHDIELAADPVWSPRMVLRAVDQLPIRARVT